MPLHDFRCPLGHDFEAVVGQGQDHAYCVEHKTLGNKVFLRAPAGFVQKDICYDSPIDGRPITNRFARIEDLRRNECVEYDPGMRQDAARRKQAEDAALDASVDRSVEEFIATAPTRKVEKLAEELNAGVSLEVTRASPEPGKLI